MTELPRGLCHYTSGQGFLGILENREFWATHIYYLNDHTEYQYAYERAKELIERIAVLRDLADRAPLLHDAILAGLTPYHRGRPVAIFVVSLTENWDDLSQWRGYTSPGDGYAVVLDAGLLARHADAQGWRLTKCLYGVEAEPMLIRLLREFFEAYLGGKWGDDKAAAAESAVAELQDNLLAVAPTVKHESFRAENEWRLISPPMDDMTTAFNFRPGRSFIVPYLTFRFGDPGEHSVLAVNIGPGPNADLAQQSTMALVIQKGLNCGVGIASAPYRPW